MEKARRTPPHEPNEALLAAAAAAVFPAGEHGENSSVAPSDGLAETAMFAHSEAADSLANSPFGEQLDMLHHQHAQDRIAWQLSLQELQERCDDLEADRQLLMDQNAALKEEIREMGRSHARQSQLGGLGLTSGGAGGDDGGSAATNADEERKRAAESLTYLKNVVFKFMAAKEVSERKTLLPVVATMLQFSPSETNAVKAVLDGGAGSGVVSWVFGAG